MREIVLAGNGDFYRLGLNGKGQLELACAKDEKTVTRETLTGGECSLFSADTDGNAVHIAAVAGGSLTYIKYACGKTSTTHLMRLPNGFTITGVDISCEEPLKLHYCVKSREGCAIIEYSLKNDVWQGRNLCTDRADMELLCVKKNSERCYAVKNGGDFSVFDVFSPDNVIFSAHSSVGYAQTVNDGIVFVNGDSVYYNETEVSSGSAVFVLDAERIAVKGQKLNEFTFSHGFTYSGELSVPNNMREYLFCEQGCDKRIILSPPFPYIRRELQKCAYGGLSQEVYMQQRAVFALQAEVKSLKNRVRKLEEERKNAINVK